MLYLYGKSGTTYLYIHLNNDLTKNNDNDGGCKQGVSYAPGLDDGAQVRAGELIAYVGDSGDADGIDHHLHFELHPGRRRRRLAVPPSPLRREAPLRPPGGRPWNADRRGARAPGHGRGVRRGGAGERAGEPDSGNASEPGSDGEPGSDDEAPPPPPRAAAGEGGLLTMRVTTIRVAGGLQFRVTRRVTLAVAGLSAARAPVG